MKGIVLGMMAPVGAKGQQEEETNAKPAVEMALQMQRRRL